MARCRDRAGPGSGPCGRAGRPAAGSAGRARAPPTAGSARRRTAASPTTGAVRRYRITVRSLDHTSGANGPLFRRSLAARRALSTAAGASVRPAILPYRRSEGRNWRARISTGGDRQVGGRWWPWIARSPLSLQLFWTDFTHSFGGLSLEGKALWGRDFVNLWAGGRLLREQAVPTRIYDLESYRAYPGRLFGPLRPHNYSYPPVTFPIAEFSACCPTGWRLRLAGSDGGACLSGRRGRGGRRVGTRLAGAADAGRADEHLGRPLRLPDRRLVPAGLAAFSMRTARAAIRACVRPDADQAAPRRAGAAGPAGSAPMAALLRAQSTVAGILILPAIVYGMAPWRDWLFGAGSHPGRPARRGPFLLRLYVDARWRRRSCAVSDDVCRSRWRRRRRWGPRRWRCSSSRARRDVRLADLAMLTATATFLVLPYAFNYDLTVVCIAALRLWADAAATRTERWLAVTRLRQPADRHAAGAVGIPATPLMIAALFAGQFSGSRCARCSRRASSRSRSALSLMKPSASCWS